MEVFIYFNLSNFAVLTDLVNAEIQNLDENNYATSGVFSRCGVSVFIFILYVFLFDGVHASAPYHDDVSISNWVLSGVMFLICDGGCFKRYGNFIVILACGFIGFLPLLLLSLWFIVRLAYVNFFIVIEHMTPLNAVRASFDFTKDRFWPSALIFSLLFCFAAISGAVSSLAIKQPIVIKLFLDSGFSFIATSNDRVF